MSRRTPRTLHRLVVTSILALLCALAWAANASFTQKTTPTTQYAEQAIIADLNGDGIPDLALGYGRVRNAAFAVQLGKGDGTFSAPVDVLNPFAATNQDSQIDTRLGATADMNRDGKADIVVVETHGFATNTLVSNLLVYLGNGTGTFSSPHITPLDSATESLVVADFDRDGNPDVVMQHNNTIALFKGDGQGGVRAPVTIYDFGTDHGYDALDVGDFDADGRADVALAITNPPCTDGGCAFDDVHILYGNGAGGFTDVKVYTTSNLDITFMSADVNGDGRTDLIGRPENSLIVLYGQASRTMTVKTLPIGNLWLGSADLNGDLYNDFGVIRGDSSGNEFLDLELGSAGGSFTTQRMSIPYRGFETWNAVIGDLNRDRKPDFVYSALDSIVGDPGYGQQKLYAYLNTTAGAHFDGCSFPAAAHGIHLCGPASGSTVQSPVKLTAAGAWFEPLRKSELWIDGVKVTEEHFGWDKAQWFEVRKQLAAGSHRATFFVAGYDNALQQASVTFTVSGTQGCSHPAAAGVHICNPLGGSIQGSPVLAQAAATVSGTISRMELWVDGVKKVTVTGKTTLQTSVTLAKGSHRFTIFAINTAGTKWSSSTAFNVQ